MNMRRKPARNAVAGILTALFVPLLTAGAADREIFTDVTSSAGLAWQQFSGESPDRIMIEAASGGVAFLDYDGDGLLDIFLVNGGETPKGKSPAPLKNALYRNLGNGKFEDVTAKSGLEKLSFYGMGAAVGDYDNDGHPDIYITGFPQGALFHNHGDGTFTDESEKAGVKNPGRWSACGAWFDYDRDGYLDLLVCNYTALDFENPKVCQFNGVRTYCDQKIYPGLPLTLYHNNRDGTFTDVSHASGMDQFVGRALGAVAIDMNDDGWPDLLVARDASPNLLLINRHDGTFEDRGLDAEIAYDENGVAKAGMGIDVGDITGNGKPSFVVTNFNDEYDSLFFNPGKFPFEDWTLRSHLAALTKTDVGWGVHFLDYDNDGALDLVIANGHLNQVIESSRGDVKYKQLPLLLHNDGHGSLENMQSEAGATFRKGYNARGLAVGDYDNDGAVDVIFTALNETPVLLHNNVGTANNWMGFQLVGGKSNRDAIGAKLTLRADDRVLVRWITGGSSYISSHDKRVVFGLGKQAPKNLSLEIRWPSGQTQTVTGRALNQYHLIQEAGTP